VRCCTIGAYETGEKRLSPKGHRRRYSAGSFVDSAVDSAAVQRCGGAEARRRSGDGADGP
jgi:hypothetical protein